MSKTQKIWLGVFLAMFLIPEILWSPVIIYIAPFFTESSFKFRNSILFSGYVSPHLTTLVLIVQFAGLLLSTILMKKTKISPLYFWITGFMCAVVGVVFLLHLAFQRSDLLGL